MNECNPYHRKSIKAGLAGWLNREEFSHAITLNPNRADLSLNGLERLFRSFCMEMDRLKLCRCRVHRLPSRERFHAIAFPEKIESNAHLHLAANLHFALERGLTEAEIDQAISPIWEKLSRGSGSIDVKRIRDDGWGWYITKDAVRTDNTYFLAAAYHAA